MKLNYLIDQDNYSITIRSEDDSVLSLSVEGKKTTTECGMCHEPTDKRQDLLKREPLQSVVHYITPINHQKIVLQLTKRYFRCTSCNISFMENFDILANSGKHTNILESQVYALLPSTKVKDMSELLKISQRKIYKIITGLSIPKLQATGKILIENLDHIVLNTYSYINKQNEHSYVITDAISRLTLAVLESSNQESLNQWYQDLEKNNKIKIIGINELMPQHMQKTRKNISIVAAKKIAAETIIQLSQEFIAKQITT